MYHYILYSFIFGGFKLRTRDARVQNADADITCTPSGNIERPHVLHPALRQTRSICG